MPCHFKSCCTVFLFVSFSLLACKQNTAKEKTATNTDSAAATPPVAAAPAPSLVENYQTTNAGFAEQLTISRLSKDSIKFIWLMKEKNKSATETVQGIAVKDKTADFELDEDETGLSYPAEEYIYQNGGCSLYLRLSVDLPKKRAVVIAENCKLVSYKTARYKSSLALVTQ